jgi:hypothetical protein
MHEKIKAPLPVFKQIGKNVVVGGKNEVTFYVILG